MTTQTPPPTGDGTAAGSAPAPGTVPTGTAGTPGTAQIPPPTAAPASQKRATHTKGVWATLKSMFVGRLDAVPLATKIVACTVILLIVGTAGISLTLRQLVGNYMLEKTDTQLFRQAQLITSRTLEVFTMYLAASLIYWVMATVLSSLQNYFENQLNRQERDPK